MGNEHTQLNITGCHCGDSFFGCQCHKRTFPTDWNQTNTLKTYIIIHYLTGEILSDNISAFSAMQALDAFIATCESADAIAYAIAERYDNEGTY